MALTIKKEEWFGAKIAKAISNALGGNDVIVTAAVIVGVGALIAAFVSGGGVAGIAGVLTGGFGLLFKSQLGQIGLLLSLPALYSLVVGGIQRIVNFNWNVTDKELNEATKKLTQLYGLVGEAAGQTMAFLTCGIAPGVIAFAFNPAVAAAILVNTTDEFQDEIYQLVGQISNNALMTLASEIARKGFMSARRWLKRPDSPFYKYLKEMFGDNFTK